MAQVYGVINLKKLIKFSTDLTKQIAESLKDGWNWLDAVSFVDEITAIPGVVKSFPAIKQELSELSPEERQELHAYIVDEFDIPNDRTEIFIENSLSVAISLIALVEEWKALKKIQNPPA